MSTSIPQRIQVPDEAYQALAEAVTSDDSPVGIDAKKTHVMIIHLLLDIQDRLGRLEARVSGLDSRGG
jgi:hypothetical protein